MVKLVAVLCLVLAILVVESSCQVRIIHPTYRPPRPRQPIIRTAREATFNPKEQGHDVENDVTFDSLISLPHKLTFTDDVIASRSRHERSLGTTGRGRIGNNERGNRGSRGSDAGATDPGHNRRNTRSLHLPDFVTTPPFNPKPWPGFPKERPRLPIYV